MSTISKVIGNTALKSLVAKLRYCEKHSLQDNEGEQQVVSLYTSIYIAAAGASVSKYDVPMSASLLMSYMVKGLKANPPTADSIAPIALILDLDPALCLQQALDAHTADLNTLENGASFIPKQVEEEIEDFNGESDINDYKYLPQEDYDAFTRKLTQAIAKETALAVTRYFKFKQADILGDIMLLKAFKPEQISLT